jgi:hypothetical protein
MSCVHVVLSIHGAVLERTNALPAAVAWLRGRCSAGQGTERQLHGNDLKVFRLASICLDSVPRSAKTRLRSNPLGFSHKPIRWARSGVSKKACGSRHEYIR